MSRYGAASTSSGTRASAASHSRRISAASSSSKAKLTALVSGRPTDSRPVNGAHRGGVRAGDEDPHGERTAVRRSRPPSARPTTTTPGSVRSRSLSANSNGCRASSVSERRRNCSGTTTVTKSDSPRGSRQTCSSTASTAPPCAVERLEERRAAREVEPARADPGVAAVARDVDRAEPVRRDRGARSASARSVAASRDSTTRSVRFRASGADATAAAPALSRRATRVVVPPHAEHRDDEQRDRDGHEPRALAELRPDDDHGDEPGRRRADGVDERASAPARRADAQPVPHHARLRERERREDADHVEVDEAVGVRLVDDEQRRPPRRRARASRSRRRAGRRGSRTAAARSGPRASSAESRGKPWNDVFAASTRTSSVVAWTT